MKKIITKLIEFLWAYATRSQRDFVAQRSIKFADKFENRKFRLLAFDIVFYWGQIVTLGRYFIKSFIRGRYFRVKWALEKFWRNLVYFINSRPQMTRLFLAIYGYTQNADRTFKDNFERAMKKFKELRKWGIWNLRDYQDFLDAEYAREMEQERRIDWGPDMYR